VTGRADKDREFANRINEEIEQYKNALLHYAKQCEWEHFKSKAGALFDYLEAIELSEIQRKFFRMFILILFVRVIIIVIILKMNGEAYHSLLRFKDSMVIMAIAGSWFELYFFLNFRLYVEHKMSWHKKRREQFIRNMEKDLREIIVQPRVAFDNLQTACPELAEMEHHHAVVFLPPFPLLALNETGVLFFSGIHIAYTLVVG
jgi:hypothetical protein